jgi:hypothetical protein
MLQYINERYFLTKCLHHSMETVSKKSGNLYRRRYYSSNLNTARKIKQEKHVKSCPNTVTGLASLNYSRWKCYN